MDGLSFERNTTDNRRPIYGDRMTPHVFYVLGREAVAGDVMVGAVAGQPNGRTIGTAQPSGRFDQRGKHRLQIERRPANDLEHIGGRGLLVQRLGKVLSRFREFARARFELPFQLSGRFRGCVQRARSFRFGRTVAASHLVGTVTGFPSGRAKDQVKLIEPDRELPPPHHSITSSARASSVGGTSRPSALAVLRLIASSYLVGACTGRSAGFSPLRMRST